MNLSGPPNNRRILLIDDTQSIHDDFAKILVKQDESNRLSDLRSALLSDEGQPANQGPGGLSASYELDSAFQGEDGWERVSQAVQAGKPYAMAFVDMRMPPGWDGLETIQRLWQADPELQIVICTAYSDYSWDEVTRKIGQTDQLLLLKKPFDCAEIWQLASALTEKWSLARQARMKVDELAKMVDERTAELQLANEKLQLEIAERQQAENRLRHNSLHDILTDLPNRALLTERVDRCIRRCSRQDGYLFAVLFLDLDNFKAINDSLGHRAGDKLLVGVAQRLKSCLRSLDTASRPLGSTTARLGGDEFVLLLDGINHYDNAGLVCERIHQAFTEPFDLDGHETIVSVSIGISTNNCDRKAPQEYLRDADIALYKAKNQGKGRHVVFDSSMRSQAAARLRLKSDLSQAVECRQLRLAYQPIVSLITGKIHGFEALVRWEHPLHGLMQPNEFIDVAEESSLIIPIGEWVLREACVQLQKWRQRYPELTISVNLSPLQLSHSKLTDQLDEVLVETGLDPKYLRLEITESMVISNTGIVTETISKLADRGIDIYLDDFGTGYSSLSYLHDLPVNAIKIDRSFVKDMSLDGKHAATIQAIVTLAHNRGMVVVVEGVETIEQLSQVQSLECDYVQGYYFSKPVAAEEAGKLLTHDHQWVKLAS
jgi:diguanylate cyclase (GGDEF)-like protein